MNLSWANQLAKTANQLAKSAQKRIDTVLDIKDEETGADSSGLQDVPLDVDLLSPNSVISTVEDRDESIVESTSSQSTVTKQPIQHPWDSSTWTTSELIVDSEPNPMRDQVLPADTALAVNHSPSSNSDGSRDLPSSPEKEKKRPDSGEELSAELSPVEEPESTAVIVHKAEPFVGKVDHFETGTHTSLGSRRSSRQDDSLTIASSDIEVVRNMDTWSVASSRQATDHNMPMHMTAHKSDSGESMRAKLHLAEKRLQELKTANDAVTRTNAELQQRIVMLNQQQQASKKEMEEKTQISEDLRKEGTKLAEQNGKQMKEIRRLRNELSELEKVKTEKKKLKEEKQKVEENLEAKNEEIEGFKETIKSLESKLETVEKENNAKSNTQETVRKQVSDLQVKIDELQLRISTLTAENETYKEANSALSKELVELNNANWEKALAGERLNESAISTQQQLADTQQQNERMRKEIKELEKKLEDALHDKSNVVAHISSASAPLLEEINELKASLFAEQTSSEEMFGKLQRTQTEIAELKAQLKTSEKTNSSLLLKHHDEETALNAKVAELEKQMQRMALEHKSTIERLLKEKARETELYEELRREHTKLHEEQQQQRKAMRELSDENSSLQSELAVLKRKLKEAASHSLPAALLPTLSAHNPASGNASNIQAFEEENRPIERKPSLENLPESNPFDFTQSSMASFPNYDGRLNPLQVELESVLVQYQTSLRRVALLEAEMSKVAELHKENENLKAKLQETNRNYDELLELDGERLERIEELQHDVIDLRDLLKNQMLAFAESQSKKFENSIKLDEEEEK